MIIKKDWQSFKAYLISKGEFPQMFEFDDQYELYYSGGSITFHCLIFKDTGADQIDFETNFKANCNKSSAMLVNPFSSKTLPGNKKIYTRIHGVSASVQNAPDNIDFVIPYPLCKITGIEIVGGKLGDKANFKVMDSDTGIISGIPYYPLNQFGFSVNICPDSYEYVSKYDADLSQNLILRVEYDAVDDLLPRMVYVNFILHEVK